MVKRILISLSFFTFRVNLILLTAVFSLYAQQYSEKELLTNQVQQLLIDTNQTVDIATVDYFSKKIITNRQHYSNDVIAKVYLLLARAAFNQGNITKVFEYAQHGLAANGFDKRVNLALQLKLAEVYIAKKNPQELLSLTELAVKDSQLSTSLKYQLLALSYRSVAYAMQGENHRALADLKQVEQDLNDNELIEHIELLTILAKAYYQLQDYQTSRIMLSKVLKLSVAMQHRHKLAQTYLSLGFAYFHLQRFDDAYNAFWESKSHAEYNQSAINIAHANKWLGIVLLKQKQFQDAFSPLSLAINSYQELNLRDDLIEAIIAMAKARLELNQNIEGFSLLNKVIELLNGDDVSTDFTGFYRMVAEMYFAEQRYQRAYDWQEKHSRMLLNKISKKTNKDTIAQGLSELFIENKEVTSTVNSSIVLSSKLKEYSDSFRDLTSNNHQQVIVIFVLLLIMILLIITTIVLFLKIKNNKTPLESKSLNQYKPYLGTPMQTKLHYKLTFKKAKKFQYPLHIAYLVIENWQNLIFHFNTKNTTEVKKEIAILITSQLTEFDYAGHFNDGEYLLLFEHQSLEEVEIKLSELMQAINTRYFGHLGDFSLVVKYSLKNPDYEDIDPYLFLASTIEHIDDINLLN